MTLGGRRVAQVKIGVSIKKDIYNRTGSLLIAANTKLKESDISKLLNHRINLQDIEYCSESDNANNLNASDPVSRLVEDITLQVKDIFDAIRHGHTIPLTEIKKTLVPQIREAAETAHLFRLLQGLGSKDNYTYKHNVGVGVLAALIGKWLQMNEKDIAMLALGATLHDVGKMRVPDEILHKPGKLTDTEYRLMKKHTIFGYELLRSTADIPHRVALVALQHHEREDGSGYPFGLKGDRLDDFTKIVSIADVFHAMTSYRSYHSASSFFSVIKQLNSDVLGTFNARILFVFMKKMMEATVGNETVLTDGRTGTIIMANPYDPTRPLIQVDSQFIDLSKERSVHLQEIVG